MVEAVTAFVHRGGTFLGVNEPSAVEGYTDTLRMAHVLGVNMGEHCSHGNWQYEVQTPQYVLAAGAAVPAHPWAYITDADTQVWLDADGHLALTRHPFGKGQGIYAGGWRYSPHTARLLLTLLTGQPDPAFLADNPCVDCAWYPQSGTLALANQTDAPQQGSVRLPERTVAFRLEADEMQVIDVNAT